jgi:glycoprotein endo-alpha-1,2-mannosidase
VEYGVDAFSIEWTTPRGEGCCGSMEDTLDDVFLKSPNIHKVHWAIFYDFILRLNQTPELGNPPTNFDLPEVYDTFVNDFVHFAEKYFSNPQYLSIDGRPVIYIWASNSFTGNFAGAMQEARERVAELGFDVFIVGDEVCYRCFRPDHAALFDGSSTFTFLIPGVDIRQLDDVGEAAETTDIAFAWWRDQLAGLQVTGREELVNFQPAWAPQYDERLVEGRENNPIYVPANSIDQVIEMATVARRHAEPAGSQAMKLIWVNTWNCWAETTTIAPTADDGPKYPAGNYQFDFLEVIRDIFGAETYYTAPVP